MSDLFIPAHHFPQELAVTQQLSGAHLALTVEPDVPSVIAYCPDSLPTVRENFTHDSTDPLLAYEPLAAREQLEIDYRGEITSCLDDTIVPDCSDPFLMTSLYQHHTSRDLPFTSYTFEKRLQYTAQKNNEFAFQEFSPLSADLFAAFLSLHGLPSTSPFTFDPENFKTHVAAAEARKLTKGAPTLMRNDEMRASPEQFINYVISSVKTQWKKKTESAFTPTKAGQPIALCQDALLLALGPIASYIEELLAPLRPSNIVVYNKMSLPELSTWAQEHVRPGPGTTVDATSFDYNQSMPGLKFEQAILQYCDIPVDLISLYTTTKCSFYNFHSTFKVIRQSGEWWTLHGNTYYMMAWSALNFPSLVERARHPTAPASLGYVGDDFFCDEILPFAPFQTREKAPTLKVSFPNPPEFVSSLVTPSGCVRDPRTMALRLQHAEAFSLLSRVIDSYFLEHQLGYAVFHSSPESFSPDVLSAFDYCSRFYLAHKTSFLIRSLNYVSNSHSTFRLLFEKHRSTLYSFTRLLNNFHYDSLYSDLILFHCDEPNSQRCALQTLEFLCRNSRRASSHLSALSNHDWWSIPPFPP